MHADVLHLYFVIVSDLCPSGQLHAEGPRSTAVHELAGQWVVRGDKQKHIVTVLALKSASICIVAHCSSDSTL